MQSKHVKKSQPSLAPTGLNRSAVFTLLWGLFLGLTLVKLGNPVILDHLVTRPAQQLFLIQTDPQSNLDSLNTTDPATDWYDSLYQSWPLRRGIWIMAALVLFGVMTLKRKPLQPKWLFFMPLIWFLWQLIAATDTVSVTLTRIALIHFLACIVCFYIGWFCLTQDQSGRYLWIGLIGGMLLILWNGFNQHYGGLETMRRIIYEQPNWQQLSPDLLKRVGSNRVFSSLVYPNAFAGAILLLLPSTLVASWNLTKRLPNLYRGVFVGLLAYTGVACLIWTGSKAGWLIALGLLGFLALVLLPLSQRVKVYVVCGILAVGLAGFFVRYAAYFKRGATSVSARFDYWRAAFVTVKTHPLTGTGPGTFSVPYKQIKAPESEMARLVHNDYLEQASDSGLPGFMAYSTFILGSLVLLYRKRSVMDDNLRFSAWLGLLAWSAQGLVEFGLYIPALAWPAFTLFGWLLAIPPKQSDSAIPAT